MPSTLSVIELTQKLLAFDTINPPGNEEDCLLWLCDYLKIQGFEVSKHPFGVRRMNLIARIKGRSSGAPLAFSGHLDTVPLGSTPWQYAPFGGDIVDGKIFGRGSSDMKAAVAAFIVACINQREAIRAGCGVVLLLTGGEETGCDGARALIGDPSVDLPRPAAVIVGEATANYPIIGHKGALWLRCETQGKTAHGAMPELGINAIYLAADAIGKIRSFEIGPPHPLMKKPTLNVGTVRGGLNINSVPDHASFDVDLRTDPSVVHPALINRLQNHLSDAVTITALVDLPAVLTDSLHPWIKRVIDACQPLHAEPITPRIVPYFTDAAVLLNAVGNPPCVILGPGEPNMAHQTDEYCDVQSLAACVALYQRLIGEFSQPG
ncbi:peptidase M20 [Rouxiella silvae]|uniref:Probable succinyl-diaminopimelate desuccinylase n=1 Tax=Rouxiella silvae TaxID=1646373 RepID=A0ABX3U2Q4_9GAMM|nr:M20 family metallopeptidase [Rouxiella silvae]ORJ21779.1 peptidase M20 [Rouxiella silvae]